MYPRILICDDVVYSRAMLTSIINQLGQYIVVEVDSGEELLEKMKNYEKKNRKFDLIFLDLEMRREDGLEVLKKIRQVDPLVEVVICGGIHLTNENIAKAMQFGVKNFIPKPYKKKDVSIVLENM